MSEVNSYFNDFLSNISLSEKQIAELRKGHTILREKLKKDKNLSEILIESFLQGSYRRSTAVKPKNGDKSDVDVIVVTNLNHEIVSPKEALDTFIPFLEENYRGKYRMQGRSIGIDLDNIKLDLVPTSAPSEAIKTKKFSRRVLSYETVEDFSEESSINDDDWKTEPLKIPDREKRKWNDTHPLEQIRWTIEKNRKCNKNYIKVVKALKWWKKEKCPKLKHPKSYPLEHFIGDCCPDGINSVAEGIVYSLEKIVSEYPRKPFLPDRGVPNHDVFSKVSEEEYNKFYEEVCKAAKIAREAYDSSDVYESICKWKKLFGDEFPDAPNLTEISTGRFTPRKEQSKPTSSGRFG